MEGWTALPCALQPALLSSGAGTRGQYFCSGRLAPLLGQERAKVGPKWGTESTSSLSTPVHAQMVVYVCGCVHFDCSLAFDAAACLICIMLAQSQGHLGEVVGQSWAILKQHLGCAVWGSNACVVRGLKHLF